MVTVEEFSERYNDWSIPARKIQEEFGITPHEFQQMRLYCRDVGLIPEFRRAGRKRQLINTSRKKSRYYFYNTQSGKFQVQRWNTYYASFDTVEECKEFIRLLNKFEWDKSKVKEIKELMRK